MGERFVGSDARAGYRGFGSFHSGDVEELVRLSPEEFRRRCPGLPFDHPTAEEYIKATGADLVELGVPARQHFLIDFDRWTFLNHGAFGAPCRYAYDTAERWRRHCESQPLRFLDREMLPHSVRVIREMAEFVNCPPEELVLLQNVTTGLNILLKSFVCSPSDVVYMPDISYGSTKKIAAMACELAGGARIVFGPTHLPVRSEEQLTKSILDGVPEDCTVAVLDWITSNTALQLNLSTIASALKQRGITVIVDGAHAIGMVDIDLTALADAGVDAFTGNCHKWLCATRGTALMWVPTRHHPTIVPVVASHGSGSGFTSDFSWDGNRDYAGTLAISAALAFHKAVGITRQQTYMRQLMSRAAALLVERWGTGTLAPLSMCPPAMALVQLPCSVGLLPAEGCATSADAKHLQDFLYGEGIEVPVKCLSQSLYLRISANIYNTSEDYECLLGALDKYL